MGVHALTFRKKLRQVICMADILPVLSVPLQQHRGVASDSYCKNGFQPVAGKTEKEGSYI